MRLNWIFALLGFFTMRIVDGEGGPDEVTDNADAAAGADDGNDGEVVEQTAQDAVLDAIGLGDDEGGDAGEGEPPAEEPQGDTTAAADAAPEGEKTDAAASDKKQDDLTDADLAPLDSKNPKTNERFQKVTEGYKQEKQRADQLEQENQRHKQSFDALRQLGFADDTAAHDLVNFSEYRHVLATGDAQEFSRIIAEQVRQFESIHGKKVSIQASALDAHPDLKDKVAGLELDETTALEVAHSRDVAARANREKQTRQDEQKHADASQEVLNKVVADVTTMQNTWKKNDPDFALILPHLQPQMQEIGAKYPPHMWPELLELQYKSIKKALGEAASQRRTSDLPIRGNGHMSGKPAPASAAEAVLQDLGLDA